MRKLEFRGTAGAGGLVAVGGDLVCVSAAWVRSDDVSTEALGCQWTAGEVVHKSKWSCTAKGRRSQQARVDCAAEPKTPQQA
jgi:hypothetical protein